MSYFEIVEHICLVHDLLVLFGHDGSYEDLLWRTDADNRLTFYVLCSDSFAWGTADGEKITLPDDLRGLVSAREDSENHLFWPLLWVARKRNLRPMRLFYKECLKDPQDEKMIDLFDAVGPERDPASEG